MLFSPDYDINSSTTWPSALVRVAGDLYRHYSEARPSKDYLDCMKRFIFNSSRRTAKGNPYIIKKQTQTTVMVRSGETIVISGLTKERGNNADAGVPGLRDLPGGKYMFGAVNRSDTMEEVLIFITPTILPTRTQAQRTPDPLGEIPPVTSSFKR